MKKKNLPPVVLALDTFVLDLQTRFTSLWESQEYHERSEFSHQALFEKVYRSIQALEDHLTKQLPASSDPGNYLHRLNQVEQDIRDIRKSIQEDREETARFTFTIGQTIAVMRQEINERGTHNDSGTDS